MARAAKVRRRMKATPKHNHMGVCYRFKNNCWGAGVLAHTPNVLHTCFEAHTILFLRNKLMTEVHKGLTAMHLGTNRSVTFENIQATTKFST